MAIMYKGFSTVGKNKKFRMTDAALIKQDLINHFNIRKGEKLMNPNFGTIIWNVLFDPLTESLKSAIIADVKSVAANDPRVSIDNVIVTQYPQGLAIAIELRYLSTNQTAAMNLQFNGTSNALTVS